MKRHDMQHKQHSKKLISINWRFLTLTFAIVAAGGGLLYARYVSSQRSTGKEMLAAAAEAREGGDWETAARWLGQLAVLKPSDASIRVELAEAFDQAAVTPPRKARAVALYRRAIGAIANESIGSALKLRQRVLEILLELGKTTEAEVDARELAELLYDLGLESESGLNASERELLKVELAITDATNRQTASSPMLTDLTLEDARRAWATVVKTVAVANYREVDAGVASTLAVEANGAEGNGPISWIRRAQRASPDDVDLATMAVDLLTSAIVDWTVDVRRTTGEEILEHLFMSGSADASAYLLRYRFRSALAADATNELQKADDDLEKALELGKEDFDVQIAAGTHELGLAARRAQSGDTEGVEEALGRAVEHFDKARQLAPDREEGYLGLGRAALTAGNVDEAIRHWERGLETLEDVPGVEAIETRFLLTATKLSQGKIDEAKEQLDGGAKDESGGLKGAIERSLAVYTAEQARTIRSDLASRLGLLEAEIHLAAGEPVRAIEVLEQMKSAREAAAGDMRKSQQGLVIARVLLARAYAAIGNWDQSALAFEAALQLDPANIGYMASAGKAWQRAGELLKAKGLYQRAIRRGQVPLDFVVAFLELERAAQLRTPPNDRNWSEFDATLQAVRPQINGNWQLDLLSTWREASRDPRSNDLDALDRFAQRWARDAEAQRRVAMEFLSAGKIERAKQALQAYRALESSAYKRLIAEADVWAAHGEYPKAIDLLKQASEKAEDDPSHRAAERLLANAYLRAGDAATSHDIWKRLYKDQPDDLATLVQLADTSLTLARWEELANYEAELHALEGPSGVYWRFYRARRLLANLGADAPPDRFAEAGQLAEAILSVRPSWRPAIRVAAGIAGKRRDHETAIDLLRKAQSLGDSSDEVQEQLVRELFEAGRIREVEQIVSGVDASSPLLGRLAPIPIASAQSMGRMDVAIRRARKLLEDRPTDAVGYLWLGRLLADTGPEGEADAESAFQRGIAADPSDVRVWNALIDFYASRQRETDAKNVLAELSSNDRLSAIERSIALASGYARLDEVEKAILTLEDANESLAPDARLKTLLGALLMTVDADSAETMLREAVALDPNMRGARQILAKLLASRGGKTRWEEVQELFEEARSADVGDAADRRLEAQLLVKRGGSENRKRAIEILEELAWSSGKPVLADVELLAGLYESDGQTEQARSQYEQLAFADSAGPVHVAAAVEFLLRIADYSAAEVVLNRLASLVVDAPVSHRAAWVSLETKLRRKTKGDENARLFALQRFEAERAAALQQEGGLATLAKAAAQTFSEIGQYEDAERWASELTETEPQSYALLASILAAQGKHDEAIALCQEKSEGKVTPEIVQVLSRVLATGTPTDADFASVEPILIAAEKEHGANQGVLFSLAVIRILQSENPASIRLFEKVLDIQPDHLLTLNNLATLYAEEQHGGQKALEYINRAIEIAGPQPALLDTKGTIQLALGRADEAAQSLEEAVRAPRPDSRYLFHLALAYDALKQTDKAHTFLSRSLSAGLERAVLTKADRDNLTELRGKLNL